MNEQPQDFTNAKDSPYHLIGFAWLFFIAGLTALLKVDYEMRRSTGDIRMGGIPYSVRDGLFLFLVATFIVLTALGSGKAHHPSARVVFCVLQLIPALLIVWAVVVYYYLANGIDTL